LAEVPVKTGIFTCNPDGDFGPITTRDATKAFQKFYGIQQTGVAGSLTFDKAYSLGFNPDNEPPQPHINTDQKMMQWIKDNLGNTIKKAIVNSEYTEDWLAGYVHAKPGFYLPDMPTNRYLLTRFAA